MIVIDTQALVWLFQGDPRFGHAANEHVERARDRGGVFIPAIMAWELAMLVSKDRISLGMPVADWFARVLDTIGFQFMPITDAALGIDAGMLPGSIHGDPADRLIIASARMFDMPLVTADRAILAYAAAGHLKAIDARR